MKYKFGVKSVGTRTDARKNIFTILSCFRFRPATNRYRRAQHFSHRSETKNSSAWQHPRSTHSPSTSLISVTHICTRTRFSVSVHAFTSALSRHPISCLRLHLHCRHTHLRSARFPAHHQIYTHNPFSISICIQNRSSFTHGADSSFLQMHSSLIFLFFYQRHSDAVGFLHTHGSGTLCVF